MCNLGRSASLSVLLLRYSKDGGFERDGLFENNVAIVWISDRKNIMVLIEGSEKHFIVRTKSTKELIDKMRFPDLAGFIHLQEFSPDLT
jgi:hypothetical protein